MDKEAAREATIVAVFALVGTALIVGGVSLSVWQPVIFVPIFAPLGLFLLWYLPYRGFKGAQ